MKEIENNRLLELITVYLAKEITQEEKKELSALLEDEENREIFDSLAGKWNTASRDNIEFDLEKGLNNLTGKLKIPEYSFRKKKQSIHKPSYLSNLFKVAAVLFVVIMGVSIYLNYSTPKTTAPVPWNEKLTALGQKSILTLLDGTKITLNAGSRLKYPAHFGKTKREVHLEGEAYFEVAHDASRPFIVYAGKISTTVLGTKFNVKAYSNEDEIAISLVKGSVKVNNHYNDKRIDEVMLKPDEQVCYNKTTRSQKVRTFDLLQATGWKDNILVFDDISLEQVFTELERAFGVQFELGDASLKDVKVTANFENESFWTIVKAIKKVKGLEYKAITNNEKLEKIVFYKKS